MAVIPREPISQGRVAAWDGKQSTISAGKRDRSRRAILDVGHVKCTDQPTKQQSKIPVALDLSLFSRLSLLLLHA